MYNVRTRHDRWATTTACILTSLILAPSAIADQWGPPKLEHWSANKRFVLKVSDLGEKPGRLTLCRSTNGELREIWSRGYVDKTWPPHMAYVSNDGSRVVLRDVYHHLGRRKCLVFLNERGEILKAYTLKQLLPIDVRLRLMSSVSSTWWSEPGWFAFRDGGSRFACVTRPGTILCFSTTDGQPVELDDVLRAKIRAEAIVEARKSLGAECPNEREAAITLLGALRARECVAELRKALDDSTITCYTSSGDEELAPCTGVRIAAARALLFTVPEDAFTLLRQKIITAEPETQDCLMKVLRTEYGVVMCEVHGRTAENIGRFCRMME